MIAIALALFVAVSPPASREQLELELTTALHDRPSSLYFIPAGTLVGGGFVALAVGLLSGVNCGLFSYTSVGPLDWGWASIGMGLGSVLTGTVWLMVLRAMREKPNQRIDALEAHLRRLAEREEKQRERDAADRRRAMDPHVRSQLEQLEHRRPGLALPLTMLTLGGGALGIAGYFGIQYFTAFTGRSDVNLALLIGGSLLGAGMLGGGLYQLFKIRPQRQAIDEQIEDLEAQPANPPLPPQFTSKLPPAPIYLAYGWSF